VHWPGQSATAFHQRRERWAETLNSREVVRQLHLNQSPLLLSTRSSSPTALSQKIGENIYGSLPYEVWSRGKGIMGSILKETGATISLFILLVLLCAQAYGMDTKTAYTRDGINFVSKERMDENVRYEYAKPGEYHEVQVPLNTVVVNASIIPESASVQDKKETEVLENQPSLSNQTIPASNREEDIRYPYAILGIGLLLFVGGVTLAAWVIKERGKQRK